MKKIPILLFIALLAGSSCAREEMIGGGKSVEQEVEISLDAPPGTRAAIAEEKIVEGLDLLVFKSDQFQYWRSAYKVNNKFRATLSVGDGLDVHFIANARSLLTELYDDGKLTKGLSWEEMRQLLVDGDPSKFAYADASGIRLPMWGVLQGRNVKDVPINHWGTLTLLRSVASVDVVVSEDVPDATFTLKDMRLYFVPDRGFLAPSLANYDAGESAVKAPESPAGMQTSLTLYSSAYDAACKSIANRLYLYDNDTDESNRTELPDPSRRHTRVVVGGEYEKTMYYYPIDFETDNDALDRVTRNWKYIFLINSASSRGYTDPETASKEPPVGLNVSIVQWNEKEESDFYVSGPYYVGIICNKDDDNNKYVELERPQGSTHTVILRSNIKAGQIQLGFEPGMNGDPVEIPGGIENDRFRVEKTVDSKGYITGLVFTALQEYNKADATTNRDTLIFTSGRIRFGISITQLGSSKNDWDNGGGNEVEVD